MCLIWKCFSFRCHVYKSDYLQIIIIYRIAVPPPPTVSVTAPDTQTVGQSLTLQCVVTTVRGITSRVDIVWSSNGAVLRRMNDTTATTGSSLLVYTDNYTTSPLSTADRDRLILCNAIIQATPSQSTTNSLTLNVTGQLLCTCWFWVLANTM